MANTQDTNAVAHNYAEALLQLAESRGGLDAVASDIAGIGEVFEQNKSFRLYVADPSVAASERSATLEKAFANQVSPLTMSFLKLVEAKGKLSSMPAIADAFERLLDEKYGKVEVDVHVAKALPPDELENVRQRVSGALKKQAVIHQYVDESLIGGLVLRVGDQLIDGSVKAQLEGLKRKLIAG